MVVLYNIGLFLFSVGLRVATLWNPKARLLAKGRAETWNRLSQTDLKGCLWFHCASLGEFEQARPVIEEIKKRHRDERILVSFFSPSGYEIRKNYDIADAVVYLPQDGAATSRKWMKSVQPKAVVFVKYELWHHYLSALSDNSVPTFILSGVFRPKHRYFRWYGGFFRSMLRKIDHFFLQEENSAHLLKGIGIENQSVTGDTRYDRVIENTNTHFEDAKIEQFCGDHRIIVGGSTWPEEEQILAEGLKDRPERIILAPHDISARHLQEIEQRFEGRIARYSAYQGEEVQALLIDNVGMLSKLYRYGHLAMVGGAFSGGLHNILEPAAYGLPVSFGPNFGWFPEALDMIEFGSAMTVSDAQDLQTMLTKDFTDNRTFVSARSGATQEVVSYLTELKLFAASETF